MSSALTVGRLVGLAVALVGALVGLKVDVVGTREGLAVTALDGFAVRATAMTDNSSSSSPMLSPWLLSSPT